MHSKRVNKKGGLAFRCSIVLLAILLSVNDAVYSIQNDTISALFIIIRLVGRHELSPPNSFQKAILVARLSARLPAGTTTMVRSTIRGTGTGGRLRPTMIPIGTT